MGGEEATSLWSLLGHDGSMPNSAFLGDTRSGMSKECAVGDSPRSNPSRVGAARNVSREFPDSCESLLSIEILGGNWREKFGTGGEDSIAVVSCGRGAGGGNLSSFVIETTGTACPCGSVDDVEDAGSED